MCAIFLHRIERGIEVWCQEGETVLLGNIMVESVHRPNVFSRHSVQVIIIVSVNSIPPPCQYVLMLVTINNC